jgi:hypothetical protein
MDLPQRLTTKGMLDILNSMMTRDEFFEAAKSLAGKEKG